MKRHGNKNDQNTGNINHLDERIYGDDFFEFDLFFSNLDKKQNMTGGFFRCLPKIRFASSILGDTHL